MRQINLEKKLDSYVGRSHEKSYHKETVTTTNQENLSQNKGGYDAT